MSIQSNPAALPAISAIVIIPDTYQTVARTMNALQAQTLITQLEIVFVVSPNAAGSIPLDQMEKFHSVQVHELPNLVHPGAMAEGIRRARAPIVALTEDHAFPAPNWAERLLIAHQGPYAAVGPVMRNANPGSFISLADFYIGYSRWTEPITSGVQEYLMGHNASYKRDILLEFGARLDQEMAAETLLQMELVERGHQLWLEATTSTQHLNYGRWNIWRVAMIYTGRVFASQRAESWSLGKRALYILASPLIPIVRFSRIARDLQRAKFPLLFRLRLYTMIGIGLALDAVGQCIGYAFGRGDTMQDGVHFEFHRERHINPLPAPTAE
jgi:Glycosyl transferase family 2